MSRWPVLLERTVGPEDLDADGGVREEVVQGWVGAACSAFLDRCVGLAGMRERQCLRLHREITKPPNAELLGRPAEVVVSAGATEILPDRFMVAVRIRPSGGDREMPLNVVCSVRLEDPATQEVHPVSEELRDELIALAHAARHFN
jgi:acyl-CoA thioesterase FadM